MGRCGYVQNGGPGGFFAAWEALRTGNAIPHFRAVFESLSSEMIPRLMILEEAGEGRAVVRFMGTRFVELWGEDITGNDRFALMPPRVATAARDNVARVLAQPCGMCNFGVHAMLARADLQIESVLLPALNDTGKPRRVLGFGQEVPARLSGDGVPLVEVVSREWLDIGFGVPAEPPAR